MEELDLKDDVYLFAIFMDVIEKFGIKCSSFTFFRYIESSIFDNTIGGVYYNIEQLKNGDADLILGLPDFSKVPEEDLHEAVEGCFAHQTAHLKDALNDVLNPPQSWIKRLYRSITKEGRVNKIAEQFGYKDSLEKFKHYFIYPHLEQISTAIQHTHPRMY